MKNISLNLTKPILLINTLLLIVIISFTSCNKTEETIYLDTTDTLLTRESVYNQDNPDTIVSYTDYYYNSSRLLIKTIRYFNAYYNHEGIIATNYDTIEYNSNNQIIKRTNFHFNRQTNNWEISGIDTHTFPNDSTTIISSINYPSNYTNTYIFTRKNNLRIKMEIYNNTYLYQTITYEYLKNHKIYKEKYYYQGNEFSYSNEYSYFSNMVVINNYDKYNKLTRSKTEVYSNNKLQSVYEKDYIGGANKKIVQLEYDAYGRKSKEYRNFIIYPYMSYVATPIIIVYQYSGN